MYNIIASKTALRQIDQLERSGSPAWQKFRVIYEELKNHPRSGTGRPERLKHQDVETWSRKLDKKNRITYTIENEIVQVEIISALGHYNDK